MKGLVLTALALLSVVARADNVSDSRELYERGVYYYNLQQFSGALDAFQAAYGARPAPALLFNIAQCHRLLGQKAAAARTYRAYLAAAPDATNRSVALLWVERLERPDEAPLAPSAAPAPEPAPAPHLAVADVRAPAPPPRHPWYRRPAGMTIGAVGIATAVTGAVLLGRWPSTDQAARDAGSIAEQRRLWADGGTYQSAGIATLAIGGVGIIVGGVLLGVGR